MKKFMKKCWLPIILAAVIMLSCGKNTNSSESTEPEVKAAKESESTVSPESTKEPAKEPTAESTKEPTEEPTAGPTKEPTAEPTMEPTSEPTEEPTAEPTKEPTAEPTEEPTAEPTATIAATATPTPKPTKTPTPTPVQTKAPTAKPTSKPKPVISVAAENKYDFCIDPGHGFGDPGTQGLLGKGVYERDVTVAMAKLLKAELESRGYKVLLTHDGVNQPDEYDIMKKADAAGLEYDAGRFTKNNVFYAYERTIWANVLYANHAYDAFISLHVNYVNKASVTGYHVYYCTENDRTADSKVLASKMTDALKKAYPKKTVKLIPKNYADAYQVTKYSIMPSILLEMGFASNKGEAADLMNDEWRAAYVKVLADGLEAYKKSK